MKRFKLSSRGADILIALGLFAATLLLLTLLSRWTAPGSQEQRVLGASRAIGMWIDRAAHEGRAVLGQRMRDQVLGPVQAFAQLPAFVSGLVWQVASHKHT